MISCKNIPSLGPHALKLMELMQLGKIEKGSLIPDGKYKSLSSCCLGTKKKVSSQTDSANVVDGEYIDHGNLVKIQCNHGKSETIEHYRVLAIFSKYANT